MRWLKHLVRRLSEERGATAVMVAISLTALIGMAAFAIDVGALYGERRQLQSGADAGALAVAEDCALGRPCTTGTANATAGTYATSNANDGAAGIESVDLNTGAKEVTVSTKTLETSGSDVYKPFLAQVIGFNGTTVKATATAVWGYPGGLSVLPLIVSDCEWNWVQSHGYGVPVQLIFHHGTPHQGPAPCPSGPGGQNLPGGFGWLNAAGGCEVDLTVGNWAATDPGNSVSQGCSNQDISDLFDTTVLIPFYNEVQGTGSNGKYRVSGFGAFHITGYDLGGQLKRGPQCPHGSQRCITGYFTTASDPDGELGGPNRGVVVVKLTK